MLNKINELDNNNKSYNNSTKKINFVFKTQSGLRINIIRRKYNCRRAYKIIYEKSRVGL